MLMRRHSCSSRLKVRSLHESSTTIGRLPLVTDPADSKPARQRQAVRKCCSEAGNDIDEAANLMRNASKMYRDFKDEM